PVKELCDQYDCKYFYEPSVSIIEEIRSSYVQHCTHQYVLFVDPDERYPPDLFDDIGKAIDNYAPSSLSLPYNYFLGSQLITGGIWSRQNIKRLFAKSALLMTSDIHYDLTTNQPSSSRTIYRTDKNPIIHLWAPSRFSLLRKHIRYLDHEGQSMWKRGYRYSRRKHVLANAKAFLNSYLLKTGFLDLTNGWYLTKLYTWYIHNRWLRLKDYQHKTDVR
ncbi:MAG: hypothetical protein AAFR14_10965, partial [Bacteroidota bacterium]